MPTNDTETPKGSKPESASTRKGPGVSKYGTHDQLASKDEEEDEKPWWLLLFGGKKDEEEIKKQLSGGHQHRHMTKAERKALEERAKKEKEAKAKEKEAKAKEAKKAGGHEAKKEGAHEAKPEGHNTKLGKEDAAVKKSVRKIAATGTGERVALKGAGKELKSVVKGMGKFAAIATAATAAVGFVAAKILPSFLGGQKTSNLEAGKAALEMAKDVAPEVIKSLIPGYTSVQEWKAGNYMSAIGWGLFDAASVVAIVIPPAAVAMRGIAAARAGAVGVRAVRAASAMAKGLEAANASMRTGKLLKVGVMANRAAMGYVGYELGKEGYGVYKVVQDFKEATDPSDRGDEEKKGGGKSRGGKSKNEPVNQRPERMAQAVVASNPTMGGSYSRLSMKEEDPATVSDTTPRHGDLSSLKNATASQLNDGPAANPATTQHVAQMGMMANGVNSAGQAGQMPSNLEPYRLDHASIKLDHANNNIAMGAKLDQRDAYEAQKKWQQSAAAAQKHSLGAAMMFKPGGEG